MNLLRLLLFLLTVTAASATDALKSAVIRHYAEIVSATYGDSLKSAENLRAAIHQLLAAPSPDTLAAARVAWIAARTPYLQSETFRFYEGPADQFDGRLNAWPVDEEYIESIITRTDLHPLLSAESLAALNEKEGEKSISTGFHAIEFLLWGQDRDRDGPGDRSYQDHLPGNERRRDYLRIVTDMLVGDLQTLDADWQDQRPDNYRAWFLASAPHQSLRKILHGMGSLSAAELAGERLTVAYETKEQEDEHSCFSDTTGSDVIHNALGIRNVFTGKYIRTDGTLIDGPGIEALLHLRKANRSPRRFCGSACPEATHGFPIPCMALIRDFARHLADDLRKRGHPDIQIRADAFASLNGRPSQRMIDPAEDLAGPLKPGWIIPLIEPPAPPRAATPAVVRSHGR